MLENNTIKTQLTKRETELLKMSEIGLWLDTYDDLFSDFDSRPYAERAVSHDFLVEVKRASWEKTSGIVELKLLIVESQRNLEYEQIIKQRLQHHFKKHYAELRKELKMLVRKGIKLVISGVLVMMLATLIKFYQTGHSLPLSFVIVILEPAGWFLFWEGLSLAMFGSKKHQSDQEFYKKMANCEINFLPY